MIVVGLGFGDEGKGTITDYLARKIGARAVVRFNGGPQAGHNVVTEDGRWHCFAQFGAGTFAGETRTIHGSAMLVELENLAAEAEALATKGINDPLERVTIDPGCRVITPMHKMICQMEEVAKGAAKKGSCGMGVGEASRARAITVRDVLDNDRCLDTLAAQNILRAQGILEANSSRELDELYRYFQVRCRPRELLPKYREILSRVTIASAPRTIGEIGDREVIFEGAQGALLDRSRGFAPYITEAKTTAENALVLLRAESQKDARKIGVLRAYAHRHGPGPFVTEDPRLERRLADPYNRENRWQGPFRVGHLDLLATRYAIAINEGIDELAITGLDRLAGLGKIRVCTAYRYEGDPQALDQLFLYEKTGHDKARITAFKTTAPADNTQYAKILARCQPADWLELDGFSENISAARALEDLPRAARSFLEIVEKELETKIGIVSVRADSSGKMQTG